MLFLGVFPCIRTRASSSSLVVSEMAVINRNPRKGNEMSRALILTINFAYCCYHFRVHCALCNCVNNSVLGQGDLICFGRISGFQRHSSSPQQQQNVTSAYRHPHYSTAGGSHPSQERKSPRDGEFQDHRQYSRTHRAEAGNSTVQHSPQIHVEAPGRYWHLLKHFSCHFHAVQII